jgi:hypothetical protein
MSYFYLAWFWVLYEDGSGRNSFLILKHALKIAKQPVRKKEKKGKNDLGVSIG